MDAVQRIHFFTRTNSLTIGLLTLGLFGAAVLTWYVVQPDYRTESDVAVLFNAPTTAPYTDFSGQPFDFSVARGKPLIVNAWATWSPFAATELPALAEIKRSFGDKIEIIAINRKEAPATIAAYLQTLPSTEGITFVNDSSDHFFNTVVGYAMPETLFYDGQGNLVEQVRGTLTQNEFKKRIEALVNAKK